MSWKRRIDQWKKYLAVRIPFHSGHLERPEATGGSRATSFRFRELVRRSVLESLEPRLLFDADPLWVGGVFIEEDLGSDATPDDFYIQFKGGAPNTRLTKIVIDTDQAPTGWSRGDLFFDTVIGGRGADHAHPFQVLTGGKFTSSNVRAELTDGGTKLTITFDQFQSGDLFRFSVDTDEVQYLENENDIARFNIDVDPVVSGVEFARSKLTAYFEAPHYEDVIANTIYLNEYDNQIAPSGLEIPKDNDRGLRDRSAGTATQVVQKPKPISLAGTVYVDNNLNLIQESGEVGIPGVSLELFRFDNGNYVSTGHKTTTGSQGQYSFGTSLGLMPGKFQIREAQPAGYLSVGATPGRLNGSGSLGKSVAENKDVLIDIDIPLGDSHGTQLDFAEAQPVELCGYVYHDANDNGLRDPGEEGIRDVEIRIVSITTIAGDVSRTIRTKEDGSYCFETLPPGRYRVTETQPTGYLDGKDTIGTVGNQPRGQSGNDQFNEIELKGNEKGKDYNFAELLPAEIAGFVYHDANDDGIKQSNEAAIANAIVRLFRPDGSLVEQQTDVTGRYRFDGLAPGIYRIIEVTPAGYLDGKDRVGTINGQVVGILDANDSIRSIVLKSGNQGIDYNFGEILGSSLSGSVHEDLDGDCLRDPQEPALSGVLTELLDESGTVVASKLTDSQGNYQFDDLRPGTYSIRETQPAGYLQGGQKAGSAGGDASSVDLIRSIVLGQAINATGYDFCEQRTASLFGTVFSDLDGDCIQDEDEDPIVGVRMELLNEAGIVVASTLTDSNGDYRFDNLKPGTYAVRQIQPQGFFQGGQMAPPGVGLTDQVDLIRNVVLGSGQNQGDLDFCEVPPATISGFVFQDGAAIVTPDGTPPVNLQDFKSGVRGSDSIPIPGTKLQLRTLTGQPIPSRNAMPGTYSGETIEVVTDATGFYEFRGLRPGAYHVYQIQPQGFFDAIDRPGSTFGSFAVNPWFAPDPSTLGVLSLLAANEETSPNNDAILMINLLAGASSQENNFSEIDIIPEEPPPPETPPVPPLPPKPQEPDPPRESGSYPRPIERVLVIPPMTPGTTIEPIGGFTEEYTWHLSVINAGQPRGYQKDKLVSRQRVRDHAVVLNPKQWTIDTMDRGRWTFVSTNKVRTTLEAFAVEGAEQLAGDFNGDGKDELVLYKDGEWLVDINGTGTWDEADLWIQLGEKGDRPVIGDWDGDGKDDVGVYGREWDGDEEALAQEPGIPDSENDLPTRPKNLPPVASQLRERLLQRSVDGDPRADVIDHVFRFGTEQEQPVAGDFNGDGISTLGLFNNGYWSLDTDGDGRFTSQDSYYEFGKPGDIAVVGDFNGDGLDEVAVVRGNKLIVDSNGNGQVDATDKIFEIEGEGENVVVGDFDGDGIDEAAFYLNVPVKNQPNGYTASRP